MVFVNPENNNSSKFISALKSWPVTNFFKTFCPELIILVVAALSFLSPLPYAVIASALTALGITTIATPIVAGLVICLPFTSYFMLKGSTRVLGAVLDISLYSLGSIIETSGKSLTFAGSLFKRDSNIQSDKSRPHRRTNAYGQLEPSTLLSQTNLHPKSPNIRADTLRTRRKTTACGFVAP